MRVERPPELWQAEAEDVRLTPLVGEMIAFGLSHGNALRALTLSAANVVVEDDGAGRVPCGEYVALTIEGKGDWRPEWTWRPSQVYLGKPIPTWDAHLQIAAPPSRMLGASAIAGR